MRISRDLAAKFFALIVKELVDILTRRHLVVCYSSEYWDTGMLYKPALDFPTELDS